MRRNISFGIDTEKVFNGLDQMDDTVKKAVKYTLKDIKSRAPGWVAAETAKEYNIKKSEITPAKSGSSSKKAVSVYTTGNTIETMEIVYRGRTLTPLHFGMTPKKPRGKRTQKQVIPGSRIQFRGPESAYATVSVYKPYSISFSVKRGRRVELKGKYPTKPFLAPAGRRSTTMIPFQRIDKDWRSVESIHTVSVPQMIGNAKVMEQISSRINTEVRSRLDHHIERFTK